MHNYTVPAVLKAWIDQIVRIHRTLPHHAIRQGRRAPGSPGLPGDCVRRLVHGPSPAGTPAQPDFLTPYLRAALGTIGLHDVNVIALEGLTRGADQVAQRGKPRGRGFGLRAAGLGLSALFDRPRRELKPGPRWARVDPAPSPA